MKISMEFKDLRDMMISLPKFMQLVGTDAPFEERMSAALAPDPTEMIIRVTPQDGIPFTGEEKAKLADLLTAFVKDPDGFVDKYQDKKPAEAPAKEASVPAPAKEEPKPKKNLPAEEKPAKAPKKASSEVKDTAVRAAFAKLIKAGKRDTVKEILEGFGAANLPSLDPENYAAALAKAEEALS